MGVPERRQVLITMLEDGHPAVQKVASAALERLDAAQNLDFLLSEISSGDKARQVQAVYGLAKISGDGTIKALVQLLKHQVEDVAAAAGRMLQEMRDPRLGKPLVEALPHAKPVVQNIILDTLGQIRDRRIVPALMAAADGLGPEQLEKLIQALGRTGDPASEDRLIMYTVDDNPRIRAAAALALGGLSIES